MDKSFNDQELSDIMKEIEALEDEFKSEGEVVATPVLEKLASMDEEQSLPKSQAKIIQFENKTSSTQKVSKGTSMNFKVQGELNLDLEFDIGGKVVSLSVSEEGLTIQMDGGMTFTVPLAEKASLKKSA